VGIDIGCSEPAVLSNGEEILNLDLKRETDQNNKISKKHYAANAKKETQKSAENKTYT